MAGSRGLGALPRAVIWSVRIEIPVRGVEAMGDALGREALALTVLSPPRQATARLEALFDLEPDRALLTASLAVTAMLAGIPFPDLHIRPLPDLDWLGKVAADFPPFKIGRWTVHGALHRGLVPDRRMALQIDATSAFGTGEHPTTKGCLLMLQELLKSGARPRRMLDMGCGSAILALAFLKACPGSAVGIDTDYPSVRIALHNAVMNGRRGQVAAQQGRGYIGLVGTCGPYDLIMANIFAGPLAHMAKDLRRHLRPGGYAILSGFLQHQENTVLAAHRQQKLYPCRRYRSGDWVTLMLRRRSSRA